MPANVKGGMMRALILGSELSLSRAEIRRIAAAGGVLAALLGGIGSAQAQAVGTPCTTPDGLPGTIQLSTNPFTGVTTTVCSATGGTAPNSGPSSNRTRQPLPALSPWAVRPEWSLYGRFHDSPWFQAYMLAHAPGAQGTQFLGGPIQFNIFGSDSAAGVYTGGDVSGTRNSGYRVTDTAGAFAPNSLAPDSRSLDGGGGINITADGARLLDLNANQRLLVGLTGDYHYSKTDYGTSPLTPGVTNAGSVRRDIYTVAGSVNYAVGGLYVSGRAAVDWSHADITNNIVAAGAQGDTKGRGYALHATVGNVFPLSGTTAHNPATIVKAPRRATGSGYGLFLDLSGHYGYRHERDDGFTDSTGFVYGTEQLSYSYLGARARLVAVIPSYGFAWMPFIGVTVDRQLGFSHTFDIPAQAATGADTFFFTQANTFWGAEAGLDILTRGTAKFGAKAFYQSSSDTHTTGGSLFVKIPLWEPPAVPVDSGIRIARSK